MTTRPILTTTINPLPPEIIGTADLWPQAAQERLTKFVLEICALQPSAARSAKHGTSNEKARTNNIPSLKERNAMKKRTKCKIVVNPLPPELLGLLDPWPADVQKQLNLSVRSKKKKASRYESVSLLKVFLELGMPAYS